MTANWASISGEQSTLAPTSITTTGDPLSDGKCAGQRRPVDAADHALHHLGGRHHRAGIAGRDHALRRRRPRTRRHATRMEESFLARTAFAAESSMVMNSLA